MCIIIVMKFKIKIVLLLFTAVPFFAMAQKKPNIVIIWGDDIGCWNVSAYNQGMMGYKTPNIDRIAKEGALFTDWYGQQSCMYFRNFPFELDLENIRFLIKSYYI